jgi:hypothetical protein
MSSEVDSAGRHSLRTNGCVTVVVDSVEPVPLRHGRRSGAAIQALPVASIHHIDALNDDTGLALTLGLTALLKATHLGSYSYRVRRESNQALLAGLVKALRGQGLATGQAGFNCDFHAIRHHGDPDLGAPLRSTTCPNRHLRFRFPPR